MNAPIVIVYNKMLFRKEDVDNLCGRLTVDTGSQVFAIAGHFDGPPMFVLDLADHGAKRIREDVVYSVEDPLHKMLREKQDKEPSLD